MPYYSLFYILYALYRNMGHLGQAYNFFNLATLDFGVLVFGMRTKKQIGKLSRTKGHAFERFVAKKFRRIFPEAKRHLEYQASEAKGFDLDGVGEYKVQCKRGRKYANPKAIEEVQLCPIEGGIPVLITQGDHKEPMAVLPLNHFLNLLLKIHEK